MPPVVAAVAVYAAEFTIATFIADLAISMAVSYALSFATSALSSKPTQPQRQAKDNNITLRQAAAPRPMIMGAGRAGGTYTFLHTTGDKNEVLHAIVTCTGHSVRSFDALYLDDEIVPLDANGNATGKYAGKIKAVFGLGTTAGDIDFHAALTAAVGSDVWGENHKQEGCAKAYIAFTFDGNLFGGGLPNPSFVISGYDTVADPRSSAGWTDNAALCIAQYMTDTTRGLGFLSANIDQTALIAAANDCDEMVSRVAVDVTFTADDTTDVLTLADTSGKLRTGTRFTVSNSGGALPGGLSAATNYFWISLTPTTGKIATSLVNSRAQAAVNLTDAGTGTQTVSVNAEPRYTLNGLIDTAEEPNSIIPRLLSAMAGVKVESGGQVILLAGVWRAVTAATIDEQILDGGVSSSHRRGRGQLFNGIKGTFVNPDDAWVPTDFPSVKPAAYLAEDGDVRSWRDAELRYTNSPSMAQRVVRIDLEKIRRQQTLSMPLTLAAMTHRAGDNIAITNDKRGWTDKSFFLTSWALEPRDIGGDNPRIGIAITGDEIDATVFSWTPGTDEADMTASPLTNLPDPFNAAPPTALIPSSGTGVLDIRLDGTVFSRIKLAWTAPDDIQVTEGGIVEVQYKLSSTSTWLTAASVQGDLTEAFILDVDDGSAYDVRIRSRRGGALQATSDWVQSLNHVVIGKTAPPADIAGFTASQNGNVVTFLWNQVADVDLAGYEIRYAPVIGFVWGSAVVATSVTRGTLISNTSIPPGTWTIAIKAVDTSENYSINATTYNLTVSQVNTTVDSISHINPWAGTILTDLIFHRTTGRLVPDSQNLASGDDYETFDEFVPNPVALAYLQGVEMDAGFNSDDLRLWGTSTATLGPGETGVADPRLQMKYKPDAGVYSAWQDWTVGTVPESRYVTTRSKIDTSTGVPYLEAFTSTLDEEVSEKTGTGEVISIGSTTVTFSSPFHTAPIVSAWPEGSSALIVAVFNVTTTGFDATVFNTSATDVGGTISYSATGV